MAGVWLISQSYEKRVCTIRSIDNQSALNEVLRVTRKSRLPSQNGGEVMEKSLVEKINELNKYCKGSLTFTHYTVGWEVGSYEEKTPFRIMRVLEKTFGEAVRMAYQEMLSDKK